ncbi:MAG: hypothetical protein M1818_002445 [Claussenomyces sp. TS43310]|nr:MAG: hypothetical protein M1818_002445 [Claussenomyces sp. TS43310]
MATTETFVRPATQLVPEIMTLSPFDQFNGRHYLPLFSLFKQPDHKLFDGLISELEEGLSRLLSEVPFLAGNVMLEDETRDLLTLEVPEDGGVLLKVRRMIDEEDGPVADFEQLERDGFPVSAFNPMVMCPRSYLPDAVAPCLLVQANLIRGGLVLAMHFHHSIVDGEGAMTIINRWAKHVAAVSDGRILPESDLLPAEALDRTVLFPENDASCELSDFASFQDGRELCLNGESCWNVGERMEMTADEDVKVVKGVSWYFTKERLQQITDKAAPSNANSPKMTESSILSAFIFRHYTLARRLEQQGVDEASYHYPCNIRSRIEPSLHPQYLGNSVVPSRTLLPLSDIVSAEAETLYRIASAISGSIDWWSSDKIWEVLGAMEAWPRVRDIERVMDLNCKTDLHLTNLSTFPILDSYWGPKMGNMIAFKLPAMALMDGYGLIMPRFADGGLEVILYMDVGTLKVLREDKEFTQYARFVCA